MSRHDPAERAEPAPPIVVLHHSGLRFIAHVGAHEITLDQPVRGGGDDAGPSPLDLLGAALGGCVSLYVHKFLAARHSTTEGLRVEVTQHAVRVPHRISRFDVRVLVPGDVPMVYRPMIEAVARVCPVHNTLALAAEIHVALEFESGRDSNEGAGRRNPRTGSGAAR